MDLMSILLIALAVGLAILLFVAIALGWLSNNDAGAASITAFHDFQPLDRQRATEIVIEQKAGKGWTEQTSGDQDRKEGTGLTESADLKDSVALRQDAGSDEKIGPGKGNPLHES